MQLDLFKVRYNDSAKILYHAEEIIRISVIRKRLVKQVVKLMKSWRQTTLLGVYKER